MPEKQALEDKPPAPPDLPVLQNRRSADHAHRGGAWKVAYADFVTALMALFIVLWMMNASRPVRQAVAGYFKDPRGYTHKLGAGPANAGESMPARAGRIQEQIEEALRQAPEFQKLRNNVRFAVTGEGLRIDLLETEQGLFFVTGSAAPTNDGEKLLSYLAAELEKMPNPLVIEGHTDSRPFRDAGSSSGYGNWELSTDRANAARRLLHQYGMPESQVVEVRGFADQKLLTPETPDNPRNRRVSIVVRF
jgi:chemotaxis protein MotB